MNTSTNTPVDHDHATGFPLFAPTASVGVHEVERLRARVAELESQQGGAR